MNVEQIEHHVSVIQRRVCNEHGASVSVSMDDGDDRVWFRYDPFARIDWARRVGALAGGGGIPAALILARWIDSNKLPLWWMMVAVIPFSVGVALYAYACCLTPVHPDIISADVDIQLRREGFVVEWDGACRKVTRP